MISNLQFKYLQHLQVGNIYLKLLVFLLNLTKYYLLFVLFTVLGLHCKIVDSNINRISYPTVHLTIVSSFFICLPQKEER